MFFFFPDRRYRGGCRQRGNRHSDRLRVRLFAHAHFRTVGPDFGNMHPRLLFVTSLVETRGHERYLQVVFLAVVGARAIDNLHFVAHMAADEFGHHIYFFQQQRRLFATDNAQQYALCALDAVVVQQRRIHSRHNGFLGPVLAVGAAHAHERDPALAHHGIDIAEIDVDHRMHRNDFGNALGRRAQHVVCLGQRVLERHLAAHRPQVVVVDNQNGVNVFTQFLDAFLRLLQTPAAFERERRGNDTHHQNLLDIVVEFNFLGHGRHYRRGTRSGTAAHTGRHEQHMRIVGNDFLDFLFLFQRGLLRYGRHVTGPEAFRAPQLQFDRHRALLQSLRIGVAYDKIHTYDTLTVHVIDRIAATAANAYDLDVGIALLRGHERENVVVIVRVFHIAVNLFSIIPMIRTKLNYSEPP